MWVSNNLGLAVWPSATSRRDAHVLLEGLGLGTTGCLVGRSGADEDHRPSVTQDGSEKM